ncbi:MAG: EAL domain-containing protein [Rhodocyclales bacterium]|nr:EAL domain-containing protein [Rhodocyclales bacterium]
MLGSRLTTHLKLAALAGVVVAAVALVFVLDGHQRASVLTEHSAELDESLRLNGKYLTETVDTLRQDALFLSRTPPVSGILRASRNGGIDSRDGDPQATWVKRLQEIFTAFGEAHPKYYLIRYIGAAAGGRELVRVERRRGQMVAVRDDELATKADRDFFEATRQLHPGEVYVSEFDLNRVPPRMQAEPIRTLRAATPIVGPGGEFFGIVVLNLDVGPTLDAIGAGLPADVAAYVADQRGRYLIRPAAAPGADFSTAPGLAHDFPQLDGAFARGTKRLSLQATATAAGVQHVAAERIHFDPRLPARFVQIVYALTETALLAKIQPARLQALLSGLLAALVLATATLLLFKRLLSPLQKITDAARALAAGERNVQLPNTSGGEVGALVDAFRYMLQGVAEREQDFMRLNVELEHRVNERTAQLRLAAAVFENTSEGVVVTDADARIVSVNAAFTDITGYPAAEAIGAKPNLLRSDHHDAAFYRQLWQTLLETGRWQGEVWNRRKGGEVYLEWLTINRIPEADGIPSCYVAVFNDITEQRRKDDHIRHLAFHDPLTGLPNRSLLQDRLQHAIERARRESGRLAVVFVDLDRFKGINDTLGHDVGDKLLQQVAQRIRSHLRSMDTVARMGGDEFVILLEDLKEPEHCAVLASAVIGDISQPLAIQGHTIHVGASLGIASFPEDGDDAVTLMKHADTAMYAAKTAGKGTYRFFRSEMMALATLRMQLELDLRHAIANGELELHYQPKVAIVSGEVHGVEALVRWRHPTRGLVAPGDFIPVAEDTGQIVALGDWVLQEACRQAALWQAQGLTPTIAVNVSAKQLQHNALAERIVELTGAHGIPPSRLQIELTESVLMADPAKAAGILAHLRAIGATVAVDDFGTGYSSLAYLRRLPIDVLKIDRSFVMNADQNDVDAQIVRTIIALGQSLRMTVVAEGVETEAQARLLGELGCEIAQGYFYARPQPAAALTSWLKLAEPA